MTSRQITEQEFGRLLGDFERTAFRLELQAEYREPAEVDTIERFAAGRPQDPTEVPSLAAWYEQSRHLAAEGKRIERVRVQHEPPTICQQWERWIGAWNIAAGETIRYLTRSKAHEIGLLPAAGDTDWWLFDDSRLILMRFDDQGRRIHTELTDDPNLVKQAQTWRDLAVQHGVLDQPEGATPA
jgi:hypothetical protein